jgi:hypothetical protein
MGWKGLGGGGGIAVWIGCMGGEGRGLCRGLSYLLGTEIMKLHEQEL